MTHSPFPPGPKGRWLVGNLPELRRDMLGFFTRCARDYGDVATMRLGPRRLVLVSHPDLIEQILVTQNRNFVKHYAAQLLRPLIGNGLILSEQNFWLRQRRLIQPAFLRQRIESYGPIMVEHAGRMLAGWRPGDRRDLHAEMMRLALGIVAKTILNVDMGPEAEEVGQVLDVAMADFSYRFESALPLPRWLPTPHNRRVQRALRRLDAIVHRIIQERRGQPGNAGDLLARLIQARDEDDGSAMTDQQLRDEVVTLFLAGHETTANALSWTWYLLMRHPQVEAQLLAEIRAVLQDRLPAVADLPKLTYTEWVMLEALRLYPPVWAFGRKALAECAIGGFRIRAGTNLAMSQWVVHRDPRFFPDPESFRPERWAGDLVNRLPKYAYFPFGGGPRVCLGNTFAMMESMLVLATMAPCFGFEMLPQPEVKPWPSITLRPAQGIPVVVKSRQGSSLY